MTYGNTLPPQASTAAAALSDAMALSAAELLHRGLTSTAEGTGEDSNAIPHMAAVSAQPIEGGTGLTAACLVLAGEQAPASSSTALGLGDERSSGEAGGAAGWKVPGSFPEQLYCPEVLQLWILQCCQVVCILQMAGRSGDSDSQGAGFVGKERCGSNGGLRI